MDHLQAFGQCSALKHVDLSSHGDGQARDLSVEDIIVWEDQPRCVASKSY